MDLVNFNKLAKAQKSSNRVIQLLLLKIQALESVLEKHDADLFAQYQRELNSHLKQKVHLLLDNPSQTLEEFDSQLND